MQENDPVIEQAGKNVVGALAVIALLYYIRNISHSTPFSAKAAAVTGI